MLGKGLWARRQYAPKKQTSCRHSVSVLSSQCARDQPVQFISKPYYPVYVSQGVAASTTNYLSSSSRMLTRNAKIKNNAFYYYYYYLQT